jgi:hypothetical protein
MRRGHVRFLVPDAVEPADTAAGPRRLPTSPAGGLVEGVLILVRSSAFVSNADGVPLR